MAGRSGGLPRGWKAQVDAWVGATFSACRIGGIASSVAVGATAAADSTESPGSFYAMKGTGKKLFPSAAQNAGSGVLIRIGFFRGPVLLGAGRYRGYGLFRPMVA
jgi:hypothetical protein